ncbi:hypothetical protein C6497_12415 [Candidatus Poribacteria bacterium]|nr:MAG: hypothetical protein C6497_12415 [Candidatus Poribacteria bacterium]
MGKRLLTDGTILKWQSACRKYTVRLSKSCVLKMLKMAQTHSPNEVGTSLVGCYSDNGFEAYVLDLAPLSSDSKGSRTSFYRGTTGMRKFFTKLRETFNRKRHYVGEWHSHPDAIPHPSQTDDMQQLAIAKDTNTKCPECILILIGHTLSGVNEIGVFVYSRKRGRIQLAPVHQREDTTDSH